MAENKKIYISENKNLLNELKKLVLNDKVDNMNLYINKIKKYAEKVRPTKKKEKGISTSQIRIIFGELKKIRKNGDLVELQKLRMKLAYTGGRGNDDLKDFTNCLDEIIVQINDKKGIDNLYEFVEGLICYLKFYGDRD
ncbi:MAG: type III-A CRISPR-associated protein Csm2 [Fusobacteriaceae bacterium]|nr:type III-A CRISPR-associated protein Csm2 [Fusobacteriaceae bacterium]